jgi:hypothetical protein
MPKALELHSARETETALRCMPKALELECRPKALELHSARETETYLYTTRSGGPFKPKMATGLHSCVLVPPAVAEFSARTVGNPGIRTIYSAALCSAHLYCAKDVG